jgi:hypothetical protein
LLEDREMIAVYAVTTGIALGLLAYSPVGAIALMGIVIVGSFYGRV